MAEEEFIYIRMQSGYIACFRDSHFFPLPGHSVL